MVSVGLVIWSGLVWVSANVVDCSKPVVVWSGVTWNGMAAWSALAWSGGVAWSLLVWSGLVWARLELYYIMVDKNSREEKQYKKKESLSKEV